jgi:hypothetical protein
METGVTLSFAGDNGRSTQGEIEFISVFNFVATVEFP